LNIKLYDIISIEPYSDGFALRRSGKEETEYFSGFYKSSIYINNTAKGKTYKETLSGLILKYYIEGLVSQEST